MRTHTIDITKQHVFCYMCIRFNVYVYSYIATQYER